MDAANCDLAEGLISKAYIQQGSQALARRKRLIKALLSSRRLPEQGWDDATIELLIQDCALMDSNNFVDNIGVGEREARVACQLVAQRHSRLAHGIGRSGDIAAEQPKAAGSSLLAKLTNLLAADALQQAGLAALGPVTVLPVATGMALQLTLLSLKAQRPPSARYVLWPRIDQKTCLKCICSANLEPVVIPNLLRGDQLCTDLAEIESAVARLGPDNIVAVLTTTSCFAPRGSDDVVGVAKLCAQLGIGHIINNAYGIQAAQLCRLVTSAWRKGRVDAVVQSTDKNFMVPVGGAIVCAPAKNPALVHAINSAYPGRASMSPILDLLMTLLHWGSSGWKDVLQEREALYGYMCANLHEFAAEHGERVLNTPDNPISLALTLDTLGRQQGGTDSTGSQASCSSSSSRHITQLGSMLFSRCVSGTRVVARGKEQKVAGINFVGFGAHHDSYPHDYLTAAAALGTTTQEVDEFLKRLVQVLTDLKKQSLKRQ